MPHLIRLLAPALALAIFAGGAFAQMYPRYGSRTPGRQGQINPGANDPSKIVLPNFEGVVKGIEPRSITIEAESDQTLKFRITKKTTFNDGPKKVKASDFKIGDAVSIEGHKANDGSLEAANVYFQRKPESKSGEKN